VSTIEKKQLAIYTENYVYGGLERALFDLVNNVDRKKFEITLLYNYNPEFETRLNRSIRQPVRRKSIPIFTVVPYVMRLERRGFLAAVKIPCRAILIGLGYLFFICNVLLLRKKFSEFRIDTLYIINGGYPGGGSCLAAVIAGRQRRVPRIVLSVLSYPFPRKLGVLEKFFDSLISGFVDVIVTNSAAAKGGMAELRDFPPSKLRVVYTGVREDRRIDLKAVAAIRGRYGIAPSTKIIGMVGAFEPYKGHVYLLEAIPLIKKKFPAVKFVLVGEGRIKSEVEALARSRGLFTDVIFTGHCPEDKMIDIVGTFDIFVLPSLHEGLPYVISEAMSLGKPVVATKVGGIPEQINNGVSGILVPPQDSEELANAIIYLLTNEEKAKGMGLKAQKKVRDNFTIKSMVSSMEELL